jgi:hypothetical protein
VSERSKNKILATRRKYKDYHKEIDGVLYKRCIDCDEWLIADLKHYGRDNGTKSKFNVMCKICQRIYYDAYYNKNKEKLIKQTNAYFWANRDKHNAQKLEYYNLNKEKFHANHKEYCDNNLEKVKADAKLWSQKNPEKWKKYNENHRQHDITTKEWEECLKFFNNTCAYCGLPLEQHIASRNGKEFIMKFHKEHVDDEGYNDLRNAVPACRSCNSSKHQFSLDEWHLKQKFFSMDRYIKITWWINEGYKNYIEDKPPYRIVRKQNEDKKTFHNQLWTIDEKRNMIELIYISKHKKDVRDYAENIIMQIVP